MAGKKGALHKDRMISEPDDFWKYVDRRGEDECWEWQKGTNSTGYGSVRIAGIKHTAHRISYFLANGGIDFQAPKDKKVRGFVLHRCDNRRCCNPKHLFIGTHVDNMVDMKEKGRGRGLRGEMHPKSRLTFEEAQEIRALVAAGMQKREAGRRYGVNETTILRVVRNLSYMSKEV